MNPPRPPAVPFVPHTRRRTVFARRTAAVRPARARDARRLTATAKRGGFAPRGASMPREAKRGGFTLLEMLIATTLVLLMMLLFAEVFGLATETVSTRKGMAANDQKARLLTTRFDNDLTARTFRTVVPFHGRVFDYVERRGDVDVDGDGTIDETKGDIINGVTGWRPRLAENDGKPVHVDADAASDRAFETAVVRGSFPGRRGYFSISENDPASDRDDVISFTIDRRLTRRRDGALVYSPALGRAAVLYANAQLSGGDAAGRTSPRPTATTPAGRTRRRSSARTRWATWTTRT